MLGVSTFENLLPVFATDRSVSVDIGKNAVLEGGSIYFVLQAEDKSFTDTIGAGKEVSNFVIDPLTDYIGEKLAFPVKLLVKQSSANISLQEGAQFLSSGTVGMYVDRDRRCVGQCVRQPGKHRRTGERAPQQSLKFKRTWSSMRPPR